jgi:hypothetical protein
MYMAERGVVTVSAAEMRIGSLLVSRLTVPAPPSGAPLLEISTAAVGRRP